MLDDILLETKGLSNKKSVEGRTLKEGLAYNGVSLWWFVQHSVYLRLKSKGKRIANNRILIILICRLVKFFLISKSIFRWFVWYLIRISNRDRKSKQSSNHKGAIIVSSPLFHWREVLDNGKLVMKKGDAITSPIISSLKKKGFDVIGFDRDDNHLIDFKRFFDKMFHNWREWNPTEAYLNLGVIIKTFEESGKIEDKWQEFLHFNLSKGSFAFKHLCGDFKIFFVYHIFQSIMHMELAKRAIQTEKPRLILIINENSDSGRAILAIAKLYGVPTVAMQHGFYSYNNLMYYNDPQKIQKYQPKKHIEAAQLCGRTFLQCHPRPDKICVYGPWIKGIFVKEFNYRKEIIVVTGQPRYDVLKKLGKVFDKKTFCKKFGTNPEKSIILITTQPFSMDDRKIFLRGVLKGLKQANDTGLQIVIKPHPVENENWHEFILKEEKMDALVLPNSSDTYEALMACDVLITSSSTTALEAMILDKNVIIANLVEDPWARIFAESEATIAVKKAEDLADAVKKVLYNKQIERKLKKGRKEFVYKHAYKQDGKATERVVNLIEGM